MPARKIVNEKQVAHKSIVIDLTNEQKKILSPLFEIVEEAYSSGERIGIIAQLFENEPVRFVALKHEQSKSVREALKTKGVDK